MNQLDSHKEMSEQLKKLKAKISGELRTDELHRVLFSTDASVYRKIPLGVLFPKSVDDIKKAINFANSERITLIPRAAGTSLAGQCVGEGLVVDISKHFTSILEFDENEKTITVQPGVIRDELNDYLKPFKLFFGPNTSTSNRCTIGGMVGNNSSGTTSIKYGVTRDKIISIKAVLSDGSEVIFSNVSKKEFDDKKRENSLEGRICQSIYNELSLVENQQEILKEFPKKSIHRRNNGYAVDSLLDFVDFGGDLDEINLASLIAGSEGTLVFITEITLRLDEIPPPENLMVAAHFESIKDSMEAVVVAMRHNLYTCELMDKTILDCTKNNRAQFKNRGFVEGDPKAILMLEICTNSAAESNECADKLIHELKMHKLGYAFPKLTKNSIHKATELRKAGLGLLGNIIGDRKAVACIEDTAVELKDLPAYISEFTEMMEGFGQEAVYYAHAGAGELHLRPILNLKKKEDVVLFRKITEKTAALVKKYGGSFSGEHGDGIVRAEFIPKMIGEKNYALIRRIKQSFDPNQVFNKGKIVDPYSMDKNLRYRPGREEPIVSTIQDFSDSQGILRATEKCNGSGDCRKLPAAGGTMCPSYRATRNEKDTTRARANALREYLTNSEKQNKFNNKELFEVFDLCLSCKACASECPSNVDVAALKAEFLYQYYKDNKVPFRTKMFAENVKWNTIGSYLPWLANGILNLRITKKIMGIAVQRSIPKLAAKSVLKWYRFEGKKRVPPSKPKGEIVLFIDEFTNFYDAALGKETVELLSRLGYKIQIVNHKESARSFISKGLLDEAKEIVDFNVDLLKDIVTTEKPLVGIEPSAILGFRDEYLRLASDLQAAKNLARKTFTIDEFIRDEYLKGNIRSDQFSTKEKTIKIHGHCQQKSLSSMEATFTMLNLPKNYHPVLISAGCCGMAGSFGYEKEHYEISMKVGEDTLFPKIRKIKPDEELVATGTSCRHQIKDGTERSSRHPVSLLLEALN